MYKAIENSMKANKNIVMDRVRCPIWPDDPVEFIEEINKSDLVWLYKHYHQTDVSNEIEVDTISLYRNTKKDFWFFLPPSVGSDLFYKDLYQKRGYTVEKPEYTWASGLVIPGQEVLDVGCGRGNFSRYIPAADYFGIEPNLNAVAIAKQEGIKVEANSVEEILKTGKLFDVVTIFQVLEHVSNPRIFFTNCTQLVKPNGILIVSVPNVNSYISVRENTPLNLPPHHVNWFSLRSLIKLGLEVDLVLYDFEQDKMKSQANFYEATFKCKHNSLLGRTSGLIRRSIVDRFLNKLFFHFGRVFPNPPERIAPNSTSITVAFIKNDC